MNPFKALLEQYHHLRIRPAITAAVIGGICVLAAAIIGFFGAVVRRSPVEYRASAAPSESAEPRITRSQSVTDAGPNEPFFFTQAVIRSLSRAAVARQTLISTETTGDDVSDTLKTMTDMRIGINQLEDAKTELAQYRESQNEAIATPIKGFNTAYDLLIHAVGGGLSVHERLAAAEDEGQVMALMSDLSKSLAEADRGWKLLAYATAAAAHALVDNEREIDGKLVYLAITTEQRATLLTDLESYFGQAVKNGTQGRYPTEVAPAMLWEFLNQSSWRPSDT